MEKAITARVLLDMIERSKQGTENMGTCARAAYVIAYLAGAFDVNFPEIGVALGEVVALGHDPEKKDV